MIKFLVASLVVERLTEIITSSVLSDILIKSWLGPLMYRENPRPIHFIISFLNKITSCGYCCSVWISAFIAFFHEARYFETYFLNVFALHGFSNIIHVFYEIARRGRVRTYDIHMKKDE